MKITHLRYVAIAAPEFDASRTFFTAAWGLRDGGSADGVAYLRTALTEPFQLALLRGPQRAIDRIAFGLATPADVDAAARELAAAGVPVIAPPHALDTPGNGYGLRFLDPDNRCIELSAAVTTGSAGDGKAVPQKLAHVVVNTPDIDRATGFYRDLLGFQISDWSEHVMSFLRCNPEHHSIAFNQAPHAAYNHTSWTMGSIDELFRAQGRVRSAGTDLQWGTGRHGPGDQVFNYYIEPSGYVVEYIADGIEIGEDVAWEPQVWLRKPEFMDLWGTAGFPNADVRAAMTGSPDPGHTLSAAETK
jgi:catechol 2,3-dioxygenase-like lactoylglutathione lyase family enzyme